MLGPQKGPTIMALGDELSYAIDASHSQTFRP
jgi:hypothetical protein